MFLEALTSVTAGPESNVLQWDSDGYYKIGENDWNNVEIEATFIYKGGAIGLIPRYYSPYTYMYFTIGKMLYETDAELGTTEELDMALFSLFTGDESVQLGTKKLSAPLVIDNEYTIKSVINRYNYQIFVNDELLFSIEYGGGVQGDACLYASTGNRCIAVSISSPFPDGWVSNVETINGATVYTSEASNEDKTIRLENPATATTDLYVEQIINLSTNKSLVFHGRYLGECRMALRYADGIQAGTEVTVQGLLGSSWARLEGKATADASCTQVAIRFYVAAGKEAIINDVQVEPGKAATSYIHNDSTSDDAFRVNSFLTFPANEIIHNDRGSISLWVKPDTTYNLALAKKYMIFQYGNGISIYGENDKLYFKHGGTVQSFDGLSLQKDTWYHMVMTWDSRIVTVYLDGVNKYLAVTNPFTGEAPTINVGFDSANVYEGFNGAIDDLIIYKSVISTQSILDMKDSLTPVQDSEDITLRATFNYAIGNFQKTYVEIPNAPEYGSPIIAQKADGEVLRKVSFLDYQTGKYKTWNEEIVIYDGEDYVPVSFDNLDVDNFKVNITDMSGQFIGEPYTVEGKRIMMTLTDQEKMKHKGTTLRAQYQLEDSYTVDFNIEAADSFRVDIAKHDGQEIKVVYEGNRFSQEKLAETIEMNPLLNPNHQGFMYVSHTVEPVTSLRVKITPPDLIADGISDGLIIVEPVDVNGNPVCEAKLEVTATHGMIHPSLEMDSVRLRQIAGRYIYRYVSPRKTSVSGMENIIDTIKIIDKDTQIGIERYITLCLYEDYTMTIPEVKDRDAVSPELMGAFLLDKVIEYIGTPVIGLPIELRVLNFKQSGVIDIKDVSWIKEKLYTTDLKTVYQDILRYTQER
jgi:hypothetical protein